MKKLNQISEGIFFSILFFGSLFQIIINIITFDNTYPIEIKILIGILAPTFVAVISAKKLFEYMTIEKLEKELKMEV